MNRQVTTVQNADLTVVTVAFGDKWCIDLHRDLADRLNPQTSARWRVIRNLPRHEADAWEEGGDRYQIVDGAVVPHQHSEVLNQGSFHHALALAIGSREIETRFVFFVDADFFVLRPNWYREVVDHMLERELSFFGAPYHPRSPWKFRYFPCAVALFIDRDRVDPTLMDWVPREAPAASPSWNDLIWGKILAGLGSDWRLHVEGSLDTGITVYDRFRSSTDLRSECVVPVLTADSIRARFKSPNQVLLEKLLPDRFCVLPRRTGYFTDRRFADLGLPDTHGVHCEEYWWRDVPFGLHLRGAAAGVKEPGRISEVLDRHAEAVAA
ncbi:MAG TPA: hypothetical protein VNJ54_09945 [Plantibacter sp.]|uniref:hypothetical protein n=1 Tax=Plantibacter sp. TaxID=1871045 RepID=UPI002CAA7F8B|nr:hypothetical protein [Plantibacter sp.]